MVRPKKISDEDVLEVARDCFLEKGPQVSTLEIAARIGLSQAALFKRFKTKEDLFLAALASKAIFSKVMDLLSWLATHPKQGDFRPQLEEMLTRLWNMLVELLPRIIALHNQRSVIAPEKIFGAMKNPPPVRVLAGIKKFILRAQENGQIRSDLSAEILAMNLMGAMQGRVFFSRILSQSDNRDDDVYIRATVGHFCESILPQENSK
ncbi:MAG: TetR/AcrR family transcriptional regulator [Deltaproteobacteria bacterium]|nr:TetR/AcrR family transcriptional regulator [Deltaproteobacteria bacterium]